MAQEIFISLTHQDTAIAEALEGAIKTMLGEVVKVRYSTSKDREGGPRHGDDWFRWIVERVKDCDFAIILITPSSLHKPWILWEAGAVYGAATAAGNGGARKVRPLIFKMSNEEVPSPIRESQSQFRHGDDPVDVASVFEDILNQYQDHVEADRLIGAAKDLNRTVESYIDHVNNALLRSPALPTQSVIEEWLIRLEKVQDRMSEVKQWDAWIRTAFGQSRKDGDTRQHPIDLRIHAKLAEIYLKAKDYQEAVEQFELARTIAPRDIFILRKLGRAYLELQKHDRAREIIALITELDANACETDPEVAGLFGRWYRELNELDHAETVYKNALLRNPRSYYLANLHAETMLERGELKPAKEAYAKARRIVLELENERNIWTLATLANADFFDGDIASATNRLENIAEFKPSADEQDSVKEGLAKIEKHVKGRSAQQVQELMQLIRG